MPEHRPGEWNRCLRSSDTEQIWKELHRIVGQHKLSRYSSITDNLIEEGKFNKYVDLTQELFVKLLEKDRFTHYVSTGMSDKEIELEISQIELTNILTMDMRKRYPESYRMSLRTLTLLKSSLIFKKLKITGHQRVSDQLYGLYKWSDDAEVQSLQHLDQRMELIPFIVRDLRCAGRSGDSQIIISNSELEQLMITIFETLNSPLTVKQLRQYVLSRLTIMDINLSPIESTTKEGDEYEVELKDTRNSPYQDLVEKYPGKESHERVALFLGNLKERVNNKSKQFKLVVDILKLYYLGKESHSQYDVSKMLGVSDSTISGYRRIIENELQSLNFTTLEQARQFKSKLSAIL